MTRRRDAPSGGIEIKRVHQLQLDFLAGFQRLMRIGKGHQRLAPVFEVDVIAIAEVLDAVHAANQTAAICFGYPQMLGADTDRFGPGWHRDFGNELPRKGN